MIQRIFAESLLRGLSFSFTGPVTSAFKSWVLPLTPESIATKRTTIPMPPSHCVMLRHKRMLRGRLSTSASTVIPVAVKPESVSKKASR